MRRFPRVLRDAPPLAPELVDAALQCFLTFGVRKTSLTDVAAQAGVSRTKTYRAFGDKDGLVRTVVEDEVGRFATALDTTVDWYQPLEQALEQAVEFTLDYLRQHRLIQHVLAREPEHPARRSTHRRQDAAAWRDQERVTQVNRIVMCRPRSEVALL